MGSIFFKTNAESTRLVRGYAVGVDCRPGADFLKLISREVRVSPLQRLSAEQSEFRWYRGLYSP